MLHNYGTVRVLEPKFVVPTSAWRLDNSRSIRPDEIRVAIRRIHLEGTSFKQICTEASNNTEKIRQTIIDIRQAKLPDPKVTGNAGSFFMNPIVSRQQYELLAVQYQGMPHYEVDPDHVKIPAGWMIDQCGWKGKSLGRAGVHDKQALVLVNRGGATGAEIVALCKAIQRDVKAKFDIDIHPEVNII